MQHLHVEGFFSLNFSVKSTYKLYDNKSFENRANDLWNDHILLCTTMNLKTNLQLFFLKLFNELLRLPMIFSIMLSNNGNLEYQKFSNKFFGQ